MHAIHVAPGIKWKNTDCERMADIPHSFSMHCGKPQNKSDAFASLRARRVFRGFFLSDLYFQKEFTVQTRVKAS